MNSRNQAIRKQLVFLMIFIIFYFISHASVSFSGNSTVTAMDSGNPTPIFYSFKANSLVLAVFLITFMVRFVLPCITFLCKAPVRFLKASVRFLNLKPILGNHTLASPSGPLGLDFQPIENHISLDIDSLISSISYVQDQNLHNVNTNTPASPSGRLGLDFQPIENHISLDIDSLISSISYVQDQTLHNVNTNPFPTWFQDDYLSLSRCNDYHKKINSLEDAGFVLIFAYQDT